VLDAAGEDLGLHRLELVRLSVHDERLHPLEHDPELLVRVTVEGHDGARLEANQVQHCPLAEERPGAAHSSGELERSDCIEAYELSLPLGLHMLDYRSSP
jgi:hypothetical protein